MQHTQWEMYNIGENLVKDHMEVEENKLHRELEVRTLEKDTRIGKTSIRGQKLVWGQWQ